MNEQGEQIKNNFLGQWIRILIMAAYIIVIALLWPFIGALLFVLILIQALFSILTGETNHYVTQTAESLATYFHQILQFLTYTSEIKPFPFAPFPSAKQRAEEAVRDAEEGRYHHSDEEESDNVFSDMSFTGDDDTDREGDDAGQNPRG